MTNLNKNQAHWLILFVVIFFTSIVMWGYYSALRAEEDLMSKMPKLTADYIE